MAVNTYKSPKSEKTGSLGSLFDSLLGKESSFNLRLPMELFPYAVFTMGLALVYIGFNHMSERAVREFNHLKKEVEDLRTDYTTLKASYMFASKQSEVAKRVKKQGLIESKTPPYKIVIEK
jgi:Bacteriodetes cell division protein (FtsL-like)